MKLSRKKEISQLRGKYNLAVIGYITMFCDKQNILFYEWTKDYKHLRFMITNTDLMEIQFCDVVIDINYDLPAGQIISWYNGQQLETVEPETYMSYSKRLSDGQ